MRGTSPRIDLMKVLLPAPFGPMMPSRHGSVSVRSTSHSTGLRWYATVTSCTSRIGTLAAASGSFMVRPAKLLERLYDRVHVVPNHADVGSLRRAGRPHRVGKQLAAER